MSKKQSHLFLASSSPRRKELLEQLKVRFEVIKQNCDESIQANEEAISYALRLSQAKANEGLKQLPNNETRPVLGADTIVVNGNAILGKPKSKDHFIEMLRDLSGNTHRVISALTLSSHEKTQSAFSETFVQFRDITQNEILAYWNSNEPLDKAGGYAIQGLGSLFVKHIEGSYSGVVGLPLFETAELLSHFNISSEDLLREN